MSWLDNAWVVGIGSGIPSGLLVTILLNFTSKRKRDREYQQQISSANREVIFSIRAGIPEGSLPSREVVVALINSTARRYEIESDELYQPREIAEELIKEVMDSSFLSATRKSEYCAALIPLGNDTPLLYITAEESVEQTAHQPERRGAPRKSLEVSKMDRWGNIFLGVAAALMSSFVAIRPFFPTFVEEIRHLNRYLLISILIPVIVCLAAATWFRRVSELLRMKELIQRVELDAERRALEKTR
jgi:hypothetical protein